MINGNAKININHVWNSAVNFVLRLLETARRPAIASAEMRVKIIHMGFFV